jgi:Transcriptional regulator, AbiEi antitoxin N-terminal domain
MTSDIKPFSFKQLLAQLPRGEPLSTAALRARVSAFRALDLARSGWHTHLGRGVYMLPGDTLTREGCWMELLAHSTRIKVVRLAELIAKDLDLPWAALAKHHSQRLGGGKRWIAVAKSGERLDLRRS